MGEPHGIDTSGREAVEAAFRKFVQAWSLQSCLPHGHTLGTLGDVLAGAAAELCGASTLPELVFAYRNLREHAGQHALANDRTVKKAMLCIRDKITWQAYSEQELTDETEFSATLGELYGIAWDGVVRSQFLQSFSKCGVQNQCNTATGEGQRRQTATARQKSGMRSQSKIVAEQSSSSESGAAP